jgi:hypothetical protein
MSEDNINAQEETNIGTRAEILLGKGLRLLAEDPNVELLSFKKGERKYWLTPKVRDEFGFEPVICIMQEGTVKERGVNGFTEEHLFNILLDRFKGNRFTNTLKYNVIRNLLKVIVSVYTKGDISTSDDAVMYETTPE